MAANANFGSRMGWERANFFAPAGEQPDIEYSWGKQNWLPWTAAEHANTRENVTVFDQTSFSKYRLVGPDAEAVLQWLCTADVAVPVGRTVYTGMLNARGTYESDVTLTRVADDEYLIVSSAATTERDMDHIGRRIGDHRATLVDVTSQYAVLGVMGPRVARAALPADPRRPRPRGLPVRHQPRDHARLLDRARHPDHLRRRARLGALRAGRVRRRRLRGPDRQPAPTSAC